MFPSILQLTVLSYVHITLRNQLHTQESGDCRPSWQRKSPSLATLVWILSRHLSAEFCATPRQPCPWALLEHSWDLPPSASVSCKGPISFAQRRVLLSWAWCQAAPGALDWTIISRVSLPGHGSHFITHRPHHLPVRWWKKSKDAGCWTSSQLGPPALPLVPTLSLPEGVNGSFQKRGLQILKVASSEMKANCLPETEEEKPPVGC